MTVTITIELSNALVSAEDVFSRLNYAYYTSAKETAGLNLFLLRTAKASTWELKELKVTE